MKKTELEKRFKVGVYNPHRNRKNEIVKGVSYPFNNLFLLLEEINDGNLTPVWITRSRSGSGAGKTIIEGQIDPLVKEWIQDWLEANPRYF